MKKNLPVPLFILILNILAKLLMYINGIEMPFRSLFLIFFPLAYILLLFFLALGMKIAGTRSKLTGFSAALSLWFVLLFLIPTGINLFIEYHSRVITPLYHHEMEKLTFVMNFESRAIKEAGTLNNGKGITKDKKRVLLGFYNNEFERINQLENILRSQMEGSINTYHFLSTFVPTAHYISVNGELSSRGYLNFLEYYIYTQELKRSFLKYYMTQLFFKKSLKAKKIENFVKNDENIFSASSRLPVTYIWGLLLTLFYTFLLIVFGGRSFARSLSKPPRARFKKSKRKHTMQFGCVSGGLNVHRYQARSVPGILYSFFTGYYKSDAVDIRFSLDGKEMPGGMYVGNADILPPDLRVCDFISFICSLLGYSDEQETAISLKSLNEENLKHRICDLTQEQAAELMSVCLYYCKREFYFINDITRDLPLGQVCELTELMESLGREGASVLYLSTVDVLKIKARYENTDLLSPSEYWSQNIKCAIGKTADGQEKGFKNNQKDGIMGTEKPGGVAD